MGAYLYKQTLSDKLHTLLLRCVCVCVCMCVCVCAYADVHNYDSIMLAHFVPNASQVYKTNARLTWPVVLDQRAQGMCTMSESSLAQNLSSTCKVVSGWLAGWRNMLLRWVWFSGSQSICRTLDIRLHWHIRLSDLSNGCLILMS